MRGALVLAVSLVPLTAAEWTHCAPPVTASPSRSGTATVTPGEEAAMLLERHGGSKCVRAKREGSLAGGAFDPDTDPETATPTVVYEATEHAVRHTCRRLGCVDDPGSPDPTTGICDLPRTPADCAGAGLSASGLCEVHVPLAPPEEIHPHRFMMTAAVLVDVRAPEKDVATDGAAGLLYQLSLTPAKASPLSTGGYLHHSLPSWYLHIAGFVSLQRVGHDVGLAYKPGTSLFTRAGVAAFGQLRGTGNLWDERTYQIGPSIHLELMHNLLIRGAWLPYSSRADGGPMFVVGLEYSKRLFDDFGR